VLSFNKYQKVCQYFFTFKLKYEPIYLLCIKKTAAN
jgi:hypothetical protein